MSLHWLVSIKQVSTCFFKTTSRSIIVFMKATVTQFVIAKFMALCFRLWKTTLEFLLGIQIFVGAKLCKSVRNLYLCSTFFSYFDKWEFFKLFSMSWIFCLSQHSVKISKNFLSLRFCVKSTFEDLETKKKNQIFAIFDALYFVHLVNISLPKVQKMKINVKSLPIC